MRRYFRTIILSKTPLQSVYRYKNRFQIYPIENDAISSFYAKHFPLYLDYSVSASKDISDEELSTITLNEEKEIVRLLSMFSSFHFFFYTGDKDRWGIMIPAIPFEQLSEEQQNHFRNQISSWTASVVQTKYHKYEIEIESLTETQYPRMTFANNAEDYFRYCIDDPVIKEIACINGYNFKLIFPNTISQCFDSFYLLSSRHRQIILSSIYLAYDGEDVKTSHKALGFLAILSAIEGLTKLFKDSQPKRNKTGKLIYPKKQELFVKLLSNFYSSQVEDVQQYEELYKIRCDITHENILFTLDYGLILDEENMSPSNDWLKTNNALILFRTILTKLLLYSEKKDWIE